MRKILTAFGWLIIALPAIMIFVAGIAIIGFASSTPPRGSIVATSEDRNANIVGYADSVKGSAYDLAQARHACYSKSKGWTWGHETPNCRHFVDSVGENTKTRKMWLSKILPLTDAEKQRIRELVAPVANHVMLTDRIRLLDETEWEQ